MTDEATKPTETTLLPDAGAQSGGPSDTGSHSTAPFTNKVIGATPRYDIGDKIEPTSKPIEAPVAGAAEAKGGEPRTPPAATDAVDAKTAGAGSATPAAGEERAHDSAAKPSTPATTPPLRTHPNQRMPPPDSKSAGPAAQPAIKPAATPKSI